MNISKLNVLLTGGIGGFAAAMAAGKKELGGFTGAFSHGAEAVAGAAAALGLGLSVEGVAEYAKQTFEAIDVQAKLSDTLGISTQALGGLEHAATLSGVATEDLGGSLAKMLINLKAAQKGSGGSAEALKAMGLNVDELINLSPDQAFAKIADGLDGIKNASDRAAAAKEIFGKGFMTIAPLLAEGSEGLRTAGAEADKMGKAISRVDAAKVENATRAVIDVGEALSGAVTQVAIRFAPFIEDAAKRIVTLATTGQGLSGIFITAFEAIVTGIATAADYFDLIKAAWKLFESVVVRGAGVIVNEIDRIGSAAVQLLNMLPGVHKEWTNTFGNMAQELAAQADKLADESGKTFADFSSGKNAGAAKKLFDAIRASSQKTAEATAEIHQNMGAMAAVAGDDKEVAKVSKMIDELTVKVQEFGKSKADILEAQLKAAGASDAQIAQATALQEQLDQLEALKKSQDEMAESAKQIWEQTRTPMEKYADELRKLDRLNQMGAIGDDTYNRAKKKAAAELDKQSQAGPASLFAAGSSGAATYLAEFNAQKNGSSLDAQMLTTQKQSRNYLKTIAEKNATGAQLDAAKWN